MDEALIPLRRRDGTVHAYAVVDRPDFERFGNLCWHLTTAGYVAHENLLLHREITECPSHLEVDHRDGDPLNNRRSNLRTATHAQNAQNRRYLHAKNKSGHRGVSWDERRGKWFAKVTLNGRQIALGRFDDLDEAVCVVTAWRAQHMAFTEN